MGRAIRLTGMPSPPSVGKGPGVPAGVKWPFITPSEYTGAFPPPPPSERDGEGSGEAFGEAQSRPVGVASAAGHPDTPTASTDGISQGDETEAEAEASSPT